jgi:hypothetical protein
MFFGRWPYKVDDRGRVPVPPAFRKYFKTQYVLIIIDGHLRLYPEKKINMNFEDVYILNVHDGRRGGTIQIPLQLRKLLPEILSKNTEWVGRGEYLELSIIKEEAVI